MDKLQNDVINFTTLKIVRDRKKICNCEKISYEIDFQNKLVNCAACGGYVDTFDALMCLATKPETYQSEIEKYTDRINYLLNEQRKIAKYNLKMGVFKDLEKYYHKNKNGKMLPNCPRCKEVFYFEHITSWSNEAFCDPKDLNY